jgi:nucleotide-binding universal stress UspA family protein
MGRIQKILLPIDFSDASRRAVVVAAQLARRTQASVDLLHVWQPPPVTPHQLVFCPPSQLEEREAASRERAEATMAEFRARLEEHGQSADHELLAVGDPAHEILALADRGAYDLIVVGTHGRTGAQRFLLGSVAAKVLRQAPCPVITVNQSAEGQRSDSPFYAEEPHP